MTGQPGTATPDPVAWVDHLRAELEDDGWHVRRGFNGEYDMSRESDEGHDESLRLYANDEPSGVVTLSLSPTEAGYCDGVD